MPIIVADNYLKKIRSGFIEVINGEIASFTKTCLVFKMIENLISKRI